MNLIPRPLRYAIARMLVKSAGFSVVPPWISTSVLLPTFRSLTKEAYQKNAAFFACVEALTFAFMEPPLLVWDGEDDTAQPLPNHPLRRLLRRPNPRMSERAMNTRIMTYLAVSGNCYIYKARNSRNGVVELWPYHDGQVRPLPGGSDWVRGYEFIHADRDPEFIKTEDIIHLQWPSPDPAQPWMAQPPLMAAAAEVDADNAATTYLRALLQNDAVPRTVVSLPPNVTMTVDEKNRFRAQWQALYGSANNGGVAVLEDGADVKRIGLNLQELAFEAMHAIPETRIAAALRVPPIIAGLNTGLARSTYSNYGEAREAFAQQTMAPLWAMVGDAMQDGLAADFGNDIILGYDLSAVQALQEDTTALWTRVIAAYDAGLIADVEEARGLINLPKLMASQAPRVTIIPPPALDAPKARKASGERVASALRRVRFDVARALEKDVEGFFDDLAEQVIGRAGKTKELPTLASLIRPADFDALEDTVKDRIVSMLAASWPLWNEALGLDTSFSLRDPAVAAATADSATRIRGIVDTTRDAVRDLLAFGANEGWGIDQLVRGTEDRPGLRAIVEQTYKGRARTIARTEMGTAQNVAAHARFEAAGITHVEVLDGGGDDSDDICNQLNGTRQTLDWYKANPLQHPNCVRAAAPVVE